MKYTKELRDALIKLISIGNYVETSCEAVGISKDTYYEWLKKGNAGEAPYTDFSDSIKKARAVAESNYIAIIASAAKNKNWQAAAWWLERTNPKKWGRKDKINFEMDKPLEIITTNSEAKDKLISKLESISGRVENKTDGSTKKPKPHREDNKPKPS